VIETQKAGNQVVVVVSAMGDTTDELLDLANSVAEDPNQSPRELDMLLTSGERISMSLLAIAINALGAKSQSFTGSQAGIVTDSVHGNARIAEVTPERRRATSPSSPVFKASIARPKTSQPLVAVVQTPLPLHLPQAWAQTSARSTQTSTVFTLQTLA
jgi:aspartokinase